MGGCLQWLEVRVHVEEGQVGGVLYQFSLVLGFSAGLDWNTVLQEFDSLSRADKGEKHCPEQKCVTGWFGSMIDLEDWVLLSRAPVRLSLQTKQGPLFLVLEIPNQVDW